MDQNNNTNEQNPITSEPTRSSLREQANEKHAFLALLPLKNVVILPKSIIPIIVGRASSIRAVEYALKDNKEIFITSQKDSHVEKPSQEDMYAYGTRSTILQAMRMPNGALKILAEGLQRAKITKMQKEDDFIGVLCEDLPTISLTPSADLEAVWRQLRELYTQYSKLNEKAPSDVTVGVSSPQDMDYVTDTIAAHISNLTVPDRQKILETTDLPMRMLLLCNMLTKEIEILQAEQRIRGRIQDQVEKSQREYYLNEQIKAIQKELGREDQSAEIEKIRTKAKKLGLKKEVMEKVEKELKRLEQMPPLSSEAVVSRHYVDWIISLPWNIASKDKVSLVQAEKILNKSHAGLKKAKERIVEFLAAKKFSKNLTKSPIICLVGPPGVGKTSLAKSVAQSLGREFVRISLGGIRDEAEIRGHRRTYIGALPGKIIQAMKKAQHTNPVILLDEIDKMSRDLHGDPAAALLEVLDPEQNNNFVDHFLDVGYDLSKVMFIATANTYDGIPYPLYDRMEIISLAGYTNQEKAMIAKKFLIPKNLKEHNLTRTQFKLADAQINTIINEYTKEAGVRQLERVIAKLMRKTIQTILRKENKAVTVTDKRIAEFLGNPTARKTSLNPTEKRIGLATGLAWTEIGGDVLEIEISALSGKGNLQLTGQLGEVMQESAHAALSYIRSRVNKLGLPKSFNTNKDIHIHIPEGATPKDGPSAGITICTALISALTNTSTQRNLAMTGEITLQGRVLEIGGLKEKLLAARQHNITHVIVPQENYNDMQEILKETNLGDLKITYVKTMDEVLDLAFVEKPLLKTAAKTKKKKSATTKRTVTKNKK